MIDFYARQLHLALRWAGSRGALVWRGVETLVVAVLSAIWLALTTDVLTFCRQ